MEIIEDIGHFPQATNYLPTTILSALIYELI